MDYSLLLAIHKVEETSGGVPRYKRSNSEPATDRPSTAGTPSGHLPFSPDEDTRATSPGWIQCLNLSYVIIMAVPTVLYNIKVPCQLTVILQAHFQCQVDNGKVQIPIVAAI